jgi:branched-chain amino acid transport system ATP-binding protein
MTAPEVTGTGETVGQADGLRVAGLTAGYGEVPVISDVSLRVKAGEIVAVLGRNGAGKTTTLRTIAGFLHPTKGKVQLNRQNLSGPPYRRARAGLGFVSEERCIVPGLLVSQFIRLAGATKEEVVDIFPPLGKRMQIRCGSLSGGEQQMLALAAAIARRPKVLLIDELSFGLAPIVCETLFEVLRTCASERNLAVVLVEQHIPYAAAVADRAVIMLDGRLALSLSREELNHRIDEVERLYLGVEV